jgi:hypothetical protein
LLPEDEGTKLVKTLPQPTVLPQGYDTGGHNNHNAAEHMHSVHNASMRITNLTLHRHAPNKQSYASREFMSFKTHNVKGKAPHGHHQL